MTPKERIANGIRTALLSCGIDISRIEVTNYHPEVFGNHVARVETNMGAVQIIFDRQYELDLLSSKIDPKRKPEIKDALDREFSAVVRAGLFS